MTQNRPYIIGLTGGIASGKSTISQALKQRGAVVIDADGISRSLTVQGAEALSLIRGSFGTSVFDGEQLSRKRLGELVFADKEKLRTLNSIMHPLIYQGMQEKIQQHAQEKALILEVPLLFETGWDSLCDEVWCTFAPFRIQVRRLMRRDKYGLAQAIRRVRSQMPGREKCRRADWCIHTTGTQKQSAQKALTLWRQALRRASNA